MQKVFTIHILLLFLSIATSCSNNDNYPPIESALDAGRQFIDAVFKGEFKRAGMLILNDTENKRLLKEKIEVDFYKRNSADRNELKQSSITILTKEEVVKDSITIIKFINSYDNKPTVLKVIKQSDTWAVDLKYTFSGNL